MSPQGQYSSLYIPRPTLRKRFTIERMLINTSLAPAPPANIKNKTDICFDTSTAPFLDEEDEDDGGGAPRFDYYESDKINGKLYRAIDEKKIWYQNVRIPKNFTGCVWDNLIEHINIECNTKLGGVRWVEVEQEAWEIRHAYVS